MRHGWPSTSWRMRFGVRWQLERLRLFCPAIQTHHAKASTARQERVCQRASASLKHEISNYPMLPGCPVRLDLMPRTDNDGPILLSALRFKTLECCHGARGEIPG